jgi:hypothetical protein
MSKLVIGTTQLLQTREKKSTGDSFGGNDVIHEAQLQFVEFLEKNDAAKMYPDS